MCYLTVFGVTVVHDGLLSLNAWKLGPTPQNIEVVRRPIATNLATDVL